LGFNQKREVRVKIGLTRIGLALAVVLFATCGTVHAQAVNNPIITVDEFGNGTIQFPGGPASPLPGVLAPDPGPGGLSAALTYSLGGPPGLVAGDLLMVEPGGGGLVSDIIRFNPAGTGNPAYPASLVFYSDKFDGVSAPADTGFPTLQYANALFVTEAGPELGPNGFTYTPTANQPGFVPGFGVTYVIQSDPLSVPEPSVMLLFSAGALVVGIGSARSFIKQRAAGASLPVKV
jgi:hypothetical protein